MPIRQDDNQPSRRFGIVNIILIGVGALLLFSSLFPNQNMQIPRVPYSLFIDQVNDGEVKRAYITQEQIRYELNGAAEGAPFIRDHIIRVTEKAFDDFADSGIDQAANRRLLGMA